MEHRRYAIIGTGAVGGYYGARLAHAGCEVHFLLRSDHAHVQKHGLAVESTEGDFSIGADAVHAHGDIATMPRCNVAIVALKTTSNDVLSGILPSVLTDTGVVVMLQNGLEIEKPIAEMLGAERVLGALAFVCANKVGAGHIRHLDYGMVKIGQYTADGSPGGVTAPVRAVGGDLEQAGIKVELSEDLVLARWQKLVWNVPYNGLSVVLDAETDAIMGDPTHRAHVRQLMEEVLAGAKACGREIEPGFVDHMLKTTDRMTPYRTSMKIDCDLGRSMEIEAIFGNPLRAAESGGASLPLMRELYEQLKAIEAARSPVSRQ